MICLYRIGQFQKLWFVRSICYRFVWTSRWRFCPWSLLDSTQVSCQPDRQNHWVITAFTCKPLTGRCLSPSPAHVFSLWSLRQSSQSLPRDPLVSSVVRKCSKYLCRAIGSQFGLVHLSGTSSLRIWRLAPLVKRQRLTVRPWNPFACRWTDFCSAFWITQEG